MGCAPVADEKYLQLHHSGLLKSANGSTSSIHEEETKPVSTDKGSPSGQTDLQDVRQTLNGDSEAYRRLIERNQERVSAMMWRFSRDKNTHEELVQNVFVEAYLALDTYKAIAPFAHWLARIATRVGYLYWKKQARERSFPTVSLDQWHQALQAPHGEEGFSDTLDPLEAGELLHTLLAQLPPRDRLVLTLRYVEEHSVLETSRLTGLSQTIVKVQTLRARKKLRKLLKEAMNRNGEGYHQASGVQDTNGNAHIPIGK
jgi:RNA polymerase sigma-70 factor, ECF subfamily